MFVVTAVVDGYGTGKDHRSAGEGSLERFDVVDVGLHDVNARVREMACGFGVPCGASETVSLAELRVVLHGFDDRAALLASSAQNDKNFCHDGGSVD
jgi:hypothetical protein